MLVTIQFRIFIVSSAIKNVKIEIYKNVILFSFCDRNFIICAPHQILD
jgi:hypothetical protein